MPHFRPTVWPGTVIDQPPVMRPASVRVHDGGWLELLGPKTEIHLPTGFYLREMSAQRPRTIAEVAAFVEQWGRASDPDSRDLVGGEEWMELQSAQFGEKWEGELPAGTTLVTGRIKLGGSLGRGYPYERANLVHVFEVFERSRMMSQLAKHAQAYSAGQYIGDWDLFLEYVNAALSAFQIRVLVEGEDRPFALPHLTAYSVAALQLYNDIATGATYRICASETCAVVFTTQRGRAVHYQRTSGTRYCTNGCARAQAERERRRRIRRGK